MQQQEIGMYDKKPRTIGVKNTKQSLVPTISIKKGKQQ